MAWRMICVMKLNQYSIQICNGRQKVSYQTFGNSIEGVIIRGQIQLTQSHNFNPSVHF